MRLFKSNEDQGRNQIILITNDYTKLMIVASNGGYDGRNDSGVIYEGDFRRSMEQYYTELDSVVLTNIPKGVKYYKSRNGDIIVDNEDSRQITIFGPNILQSLNPRQFAYRAGSNPTPIEGDILIKVTNKK